MIKLQFPKTDKRSNTSQERPLNPNRKWLFQGALGFVDVDRNFRNTVAIKFVGAPKNEFDLVSPEFVKSTDKQIPSR